MGRRRPVIIIAALLVCCLCSFGQQSTGSVQNACANPFSTLQSVSLNIASATTTQLVALVAGQKIHVCSFLLIGGGTSPTMQFEYGTGSTCGTGTTALMPAVAVPATLTSFSGPVITVTAAGNALCLVSAGTSPTIKGLLTFVQQ